MEKLGIQPTLLLAQLVNFLIILFVLSKLLYKPILDMLDKRKKKIAEGLELTEKMKSEEEKWAAKKEKLMTDARADAKLLIEDAKKQAAIEVQTIVDDARKEADSLMEKTRKEIEAERANLLKSVQAEAVMIARMMVQKVLAGNMTDKAQHDIINRKLSELSNVSAHVS